MALIAMAVHDTEENNRTEYTLRTINKLFQTVDFHKHRLFIIDNNSCTDTKELLASMERSFDNVEDPSLNKVRLITLIENIGTARAINIAWKERLPGENLIKMDNDVVIHYNGWVDQMDDAISRDASLGQVGLKRKDCWEYPTHPEKEWRSELLMLPHKPGEAWIVVERAKHIMGTCVMHSAALIDRVGYLYQPGLYGYDDVLMSWRSSLAGFKNVFLPHINIDHIDAGTTPYQGWKERHSGEYTKQVSDLVDQYISKQKSLYYDHDSNNVHL